MKVASCFSSTLMLVGLFSLVVGNELANPCCQQIGFVWLA